MMAFDTDIISDMTNGRRDYLDRLSAIEKSAQYAPIVVIEESLRGWLNLLKLAESRKAKTTLNEAYNRLEHALAVTSTFRILPYTVAADALFTAWRAAKIRIGTQDLRIAAICVVHGAKLITRNRRDYELVPGLSLEIWN